MDEFKTFLAEQEILEEDASQNKKKNRKKNKK